MSNAANDWWSRQLGTPTQPVQPQPVYPPQQTPSPYPPPQFQQPQQAYPPQYAPQQPYPPQPYPPQQAPVQAVPQGPVCPSCRSGNYVIVGKTPVTQNGPQQDIYRCYDCGYPTAKQAGSGATFRDPNQGPARPARQVATGGWNPTTIIGHL